MSAAVASTGRAVATTSRAVGGALSQARGALSGWWSALTAPAPADAAAEPELPPASELPAEPELLQPDERTNSDVEEADTDLQRDNRTQLRPDSPDPPDKSIDDTTINLNKIQVI